jgi:hypothetical protein
MRDDLLDAYAAADWAITHLDTFKQRLKTWIDSPPYSVFEEPHPEMGQKLLKLHVDRPLPLTFNAEVGAIINTVRTSLDLLASALARRNGKTPSPDHHFPIYRCVMDFIDPLSVKKRKSWLAEDARVIIENLKPYRGGNNRLFALHHFDVVRKHERLLDVRTIPGAVMVSPAAHCQGLQFRSIWPGFNDDAVIAWTSIDATDCQFQMTLSVTFNEGDLIANEPVEQALRDFWRMATMIIEMFETGHS